LVWLVKPSSRLNQARISKCRIGSSSKTADVGLLDSARPIHNWIAKASQGEGPLQSNSEEKGASPVSGLPPLTWAGHSAPTFFDGEHRQDGTEGPTYFNSLPIVLA